MVLVGGDESDLMETAGFFKKRRLASVAEQRVACLGMCPLAAHRAALIGRRLRGTLKEATPCDS